MTKSIVFNKPYLVPEAESYIIEAVRSVVTAAIITGTKSVSLL